MSDVKAKQPGARDEPGDGVSAPLTAAAGSRSSPAPPNGNGNGHATQHTGNGNGSRPAERAATGNGNGASTATRAPLHPGELSALVDSARRTIDDPPAPPIPDELDDGAETFADLDELSRDDLDELSQDDLEPRARTRRGPREGRRRRARRDDHADPAHLLERPPPPQPLPADRRAKLLASLARNAEELARGERRDAAPALPVRPRSRTARRLLAVAALVAPPVALAVMLTAEAPSGSLSRADAAFVSGQLVVADQRLRAQLVRVPANGTAVAIARAREAELTTRSLAIEVQSYGGPRATLLRRALRLERRWIAAVGSTLMNPRSALRGKLVARGAAAREALEALPGPSGKRIGGARSLVDYALSRVRATRAGTP